MKKGYYIIYEELDGNRFRGVSNKIRNQIRAMRDHGIEAETKLYKISDSSITKVLYRLPFANAGPHWKYDKDFDGCDFIYMRKPYLSLSFLLFLQQIKKRSQAAVIVEFPTFPYDGELKGRWIDYPLFIKDFIARHFLKGRIDLAVTPGNGKVFGLKTVRILNGFDFSEIRIKNCGRKDDQIRLCCIAKFVPQHGYERLLKGLIDYYRSAGTRDVTVYFVGTGKELESYRKIAREGHIEKHAVFCGFRTGRDIEKILNRSDFGVGALGMYKVGFDGMGAYLKTREYLAAGLPVITGGKLDVMDYPELNPYVLAFENNETPVCIQSIIDYFDKNGGRLSTDKRRVIRSFAEKRLNMCAAMKPVTDYINGL